MDELLYKLLEQTPTIIAMGVGLFALWKEKGKLQREAVSERKESKEMIERIISEHKVETKELNDYIRDRESTFSKAIINFNTITEELENKQKSMLERQDSILLKIEEVLVKVNK
jgi:uncharacterized protein HemX